MAFLAWGAVGPGVTSSKNSNKSGKSTGLLCYFYDYNKNAIKSAEHALLTYFFCLKITGPQCSAVLLWHKDLACQFLKKILLPNPPPPGTLLFWVNCLAGHRMCIKSKVQSTVIASVCCCLAGRPSAHSWLSEHCHGHLQKPCQG